MNLKNKISPVMYKKCFIKIFTLTQSRPRTQTPSTSFSDFNWTKNLQYIHLFVYLVNQKLEILFNHLFFYIHTTCSNLEFRFDIHLITI